jgi:colanic acid/amylovoran biosynthesis glycosyltransferase
MDALRVAYILLRFPRLTQTFILREMVHLRRLGVDVQVFSILPPVSEPVHGQAQEIMPYVHYGQSLISAEMIRAHLHYLFRSPARFFRALLRAIWQSYREPGVLLRALAVFPLAVTFAKQIEDLKVDHVHAHFVWVEGIVAQVISDLTDIPFSLHPHAFDLFQRDQESVRRQLALSDGVIAISEYHRRYMAQLSSRPTAENIKVVYNGLDTEELAPARARREEGEVRVLSVGSFCEKKGHEYLIDACALLVGKGYALRCSIVGDGLLKASLQARINRYGLQGRVSLLGAKTQEEVKVLYGSSDIFVLACVVAANGDSDGVPTVLVEALAMKLPVVTTPVAGIPEFVIDGETGLLVPQRDVEALANAMERLMVDEELRRRLGERGRQVVVDTFDVRRTSPQLAAFFSDVRRHGDS